MFGIKKETWDDVLTVFAAILLFNTIPKIPQFGALFQKYWIIGILIAFIIIMKRKSIAQSLGD